MTNTGLLCYINHMEPLPSSGQRLWRGHLLVRCSVSSFGSAVYIGSSFSHFQKRFYGQSDLVDVNAPYGIFLPACIPYSSNKSVSRYLASLYYGISVLPFLFRLRPTVVVSSYPYASAVFASFVYSVLTRAKLVLDFRDSPAKSFGNGTLTRIISLLFSSIELALIAPSVFYCSKIVGPGDSVLSYLYRSSPLFSLLSSRINSKYSTLLMPYEYPPSYRLPPVTSLAASKVSAVIFAGSLVEAFDLLSLIDLFSSFGERHQLWIAGDGPLRSQVEYLSSSNPNVSYLGGLASLDLSSYLERASVGILPYSCGKEFDSHVTNKFPEYLAHGLRLIVPAWCSEMASLVEVNQLGLVYNSLPELVAIVNGEVSLVPSSLACSQALEFYGKYFSPLAFAQSCDLLFSQI